MRYNLRFAEPRTNDPEELVELSLMWKSLHEVYGDKIMLLGQKETPEDNDIIFGLPTMKQRVFSNNWLSEDYHEIDAFRQKVSRAFRVCDYEGAEDFVKFLSYKGKGAFIKSVNQKEYTGSGEAGQSLVDIMGAHAISFCDRRGKSLIVQEKVSFSHEYRCVVVDGEVVTSSPVLHKATPFDVTHPAFRGLDPSEILFADPKLDYGDFVHEPGLTGEMLAMADEIASGSNMVSGTIDIGLMNGKDIEPIEMNIGWPGHYGLFLCDPRVIAEESVHIFNEKVLSNLFGERAEQLHIEDDEEWMDP